MTNHLVPLMSVLITFAPLSLAAKGRTVRIAITSPAWSVPVEVVDAAVGRFHIWEGPGTFVNRVAQTDGFIANWVKGPVAQRPAGLRRYQVAFYSGCNTRNEPACNTDEPLLSYVVMYEYDAATNQGYVYLPGRGEPWYELNIRSILRHGLEGNWFNASVDWQQFVGPYLSRPQ